MKLGREWYREIGAEMFLLYKQTLDGTTILAVDRVRENKEARIRNNARLRFECLLRLFSSIETLTEAATRVHQKARTAPFSNLLKHSGKS